MTRGVPLFGVSYTLATCARPITTQQLSAHLAKHLLFISGKVHFRPKQKPPLPYSINSGTVLTALTSWPPSLWWLAVGIAELQTPLDCTCVRGDTLWGARGGGGLRRRSQTARRCYISCLELGDSRRDSNVSMKRIRGFLCRRRCYQ